MESGKDKIQKQGNLTDKQKLLEWMALGMCLMLLLVSFLKVIFF